jgi:hypothetical protein
MGFQKALGAMCLQNPPEAPFYVALWVVLNLVTRLVPSS